MIQKNSELPLLELNRIEKRFAKQITLHEISLKLYSGTITALIGDNGAGKSTLVKVITGQYPPDAGTMYWNQQLIHYKKGNRTKAARNLGIQTVYQHLGLIEELSILRNFFLDNELTKGVFPFRTLDMRGMRQIVSEQLKRFKMDKKFHPDVPIANLSGGERQIIAICRAMYFNAKLLILDEPTSALSNRQADLINSHIKEAAQANIAVLLITHRLEQVSSIADQVITLSHGRITQDINAKNFDFNQRERQ